ncbi:MAG TPA: hypothetical protein VFY14_20985 [Streptomyces sp.]|nr:hypothetical protein [Streptomyces sp.]
MSTPTAPGPGHRVPAAALDFTDPLSVPSDDDTDRGWNERPGTGDGADELTRFLEEKPPHHL